jgi:hypothetical protein
MAFAVPQAVRLRHLYAHAPAAMQRLSRSHNARSVVPIARQLHAQ